MDQNGFDRLIEHWNMKGLFIGLGVGFVLEIFLIRTNRNKPRWSVSILSVLAVGLFGWITFDIASAALPENAWKPSFWAFVLSSNVWVGAKLTLDGRAALVMFEIFVPQIVKNLWWKSQNAKIESTKDSD